MLIHTKGIVLHKIFVRSMSVTNNTVLVEIPCRQLR